MFCILSIIGLSFIAFVIDGNVKSYGLLYLELLDKYDEGPQRTGMTGTVFGVTGLTLGIVFWVVLFFDNGSTSLILKGPIPSF